MNYKNKAVVLGTNYYIGLAVVRSLGKAGVHVISVDYDEYNPYGKSKYVKQALIAPHYKDQEEAYLEFLINLARNEEHKPVLMPTADPYVEFIDKYFFELKDYYLFPMDKKGLLTSLMDKDKLAEMAKDHGVPTPEIIRDNEENIIARTRTEIGYPCVIKPVDSPTFVDEFREKMFYINNEQELIEGLQRARDKGHPVFIQKVILGPETNNYNFDAYMNQAGKVAWYTTERKLRQWPTNFGASTLAEQKWIPEAAAFSIPFLEAIGFKGFVEVEMKRDERDGKIYLIEVNVRYVNFTQLHVDVGFNTPLLTYREMVGEDIGTGAIDYDTGYRWRYLYEDIPAMRNYVEIGQMTREEINEQNRHRPVVASTWSWSDPWPGIKFVYSLFRRRFLRLFGR